jgi:hypothetical protein
MINPALMLARTPKVIHTARRPSSPDYPPRIQSAVSSSRGRHSKLLSFESLENRFLLATLTATGGSLSASVMASDSLGQPNSGADNHTVSVDGTCSSGCGTSAVVNLAHQFPDDAGFVLSSDAQGTSQYYDFVLRAQGVGDHEFRKGEDVSYDEEVAFQGVTLEILPSPGEARGDPILLRFESVLPAPSPGQTIHTVLSVGMRLLGQRPRYQEGPPEGADSVR